MPEAFICDGIRTPIGRYAGGLAKVRTDDLAAVPLRALMKRNPNVDWSALDEVVFGCANQAGEDNRNVARMALLLAGLPETVPGVTVNRLCASGLNAVGYAAQAIRAGEMDFAIAGGVESMTRAPLVMGKAQEAFQRSAQIEDTTIGWRFINPLMKKQYGVDAMPETAENVAEDYQVARKDQDAFALRSQQRATKAQAAGFFAEEIEPVIAPGGKAGPITVDKDEHIRPDTTIDGLAKLKNVRARPRHRHRRQCVRRQRRRRRHADRFRGGGEEVRPQADRAHHRHGAAGVPPRVMGIGPVPSTRKLMERLKLKIGDFDVIEFNEAFASQALACLRQLGIAGRCRARQSERRRDRARPSARHVGHAARHHRDPSHDQDRRQARARHHVRRCRAGRVAGNRAGVTDDDLEQPSFIGGPLWPADLW